MRSRATLLLICQVVAAGCNLSGDSAGAPADILFVPPQAQEVGRPSQGANESVVRYRIGAAFPADDFLGQLRSHFEERGWKPLAHDWLNPTIPSAHERGWGSFVDASQETRKKIHQWIAQWTNARGDIVNYALRYESPMEGEERADPSSPRMEVSGAFITAANAKRVVARAAEMQKSFDPPNEPAADERAPIVQLFPGTSSPDEEVELQSISGGGRTQVFSVARSVVEAVPDWEPEKGEAPLSVSAAVAAAKAAVAARHPKFDDFKATAISLHGINCYPAIPGKWYYVITFSPLVEGRTFFGSGMWEVVLMDGTVVEPKTAAKRSTP